MQDVASFIDQIHIAGEMRLVLDTSVVIAGLRSPGGASAEILRRALAGELTMLASVPLFVEYEAVATRAEHLDAAGCDRHDIENVLAVLAGTVEPVEIRYLWRPQLRDPDDEMVLETAVNGRADAIVTFNLRDFGSVASRFGIEVVRPADALRR